MATLVAASQIGLSKSKMRRTMLWALCFELSRVLPPGDSRPLKAKSSRSTISPLLTFCLQQKINLKNPPGISFSLGLEARTSLGIQETGSPGDASLEALALASPCPIRISELLRVLAQNKTVPLLWRAHKTTALWQLLLLKGAPNVFKAEQDQTHA